MLPNYQLGGKILLAQCIPYINEKKVISGVNKLKIKPQHCYNLTLNIAYIINNNKRSLYKTITFLGWDLTQVSRPIVTFKCDKLKHVL